MKYYKLTIIAEEEEEKFVFQWLMSAIKIIIKEKGLWKVKHMSIEEVND